MSATGSGIEGLLADCAFARLVGDSLRSETLKLIDVGCSGGLPQGFRVFGDRLSALAFDGLPDEAARLAAAEANPKVRYVAGFVGVPADSPLAARINGLGAWHNWPGGRYAFERQADLRAAKAEGRTPTTVEEYFRQIFVEQDWSTRPWAGYDTDYAADFGAGTPVAPQAGPGPDGLIHLSAFVNGAGFEDADFLKLDIDGPDWEVLRASTDLLERPTLLGAALEVNFIGSHHANDNTFHNMDRLMREKGFHLAALSVRTYASAALPWPYLDVHPSMNFGGRPVQGDAVYLRDLGSRVYKDEAAALSDEKLAKSAALHAMFSLPDYAAEILLVHRERLSRLFDVDQALDLLALQVQENDPVKKSYRDYVAAFEAEEPQFFDLYTRRNTWMSNVLKAAAEAPELARRIEAAEAAAEATASALRQALTQAEADAERERHERRQAEARVAALESSTSWRLTAPLRALLGGGKRRA